MPGFSNKVQWDTCLGKVTRSRMKYIENSIKHKLPEVFVKNVLDCNYGVPKKSEFRYFDVYLKKSVITGIGVFLSLEQSEYENFLDDFFTPPEFFPKNIIAFAITGNGDSICFDYRTNASTDNPPIVYWNHEAPEGEDVSFIAHNFEEFLSLLRTPDY